MLLNANIFQPLIDVFESVLKFFHNSIGVPWGWSIVLLTIAVRACLIPLTVKQIGSMARLQQLQPQIKEIQAKYKEDKQRQQQEMMNFYKENKVNPLGSCLPMVAQLPVFISLYYMLRQSLRVDICPAVQKAHNHGVLSTAHTVACGGGHGASFLFIGDLTNKASGGTLIVLIILYVGTQLGSSLMMSAATMDRTQRQIMLFMPLLFVLFVIRFPAGVLVYWVTTNTWTIGQQYIVKRRIGPLKPATAGGAGGAAAGGGGPPSPSVLPKGPSRWVGGGRNGASTNVSDPRPNGSGSSGSGGGGALGALIRRAKPAEEEPKVVSGNRGASRGGPPPKAPRKKKKRSGRRR
ncbi:MAG: YidC/Oxa1 family membrane protein insertase [Solirubrobacteraceae bacterium]|jgi:YidC/Oxa1 family membrane protein insertase